MVGGPLAGRVEVARAGPVVEPEAVALEGVGGQRDPLGTGAREPRRPVDVDAVDVNRAERAEQRLGLETVAPQGRREHRRGVALITRLCRDAAAGRGRQHAVGTELEVGRDALAGERAHAVGEAHRLAHVPHPVARGRDLLAGDLARHVRHDRNPRRRERQPLDAARELRQHRLHQRRMERMTDPQPLDPPTLALPAPRELAHRILVTGDHHRARTVHRRDTRPHHDPPSDARTSSSDASTATIAPPAGNACINRPRAATSRHASSSDNTPATCAAADLTDRMTGQHIRPHPQRLHQPEQRHLDREQRRLREHRPIQQPRRPRTPTTSANTHTRAAPVKHTVQRRTHRVERLREHRERLIQLPAHPGPLRTLTREQQRQPTADRRRPRHDPRRGAAARQRARPANSSSRSPPPPPRGARTAHGRPPATAPHRRRRAPGAPRRRPRSRPAWRPQRLRHRADTTHGTSAAPDGHRLAADSVPRWRLARRASSRITCALVPLIPNDDTPARRGRSSAGHGDRLGQQLHRARRPVHVRRRLIHVQASAAAPRAASPAPS